MQKKIAEYPKKVMALEKMYESIPGIKKLSEEMENIDRAKNPEEELRRKLKLLKGYRISLDALYDNYIRIRDDIGADLKDLKEEEPDETVRLSMIQAEQLILSVNASAGTLGEERKSLDFSIQKLEMLLKGMKEKSENFMN
ncbi:hypothetical protein QYZ88_002995 [Lachnospiraceae bacterium C1.1]|nr:hypothetical protein [Lachnospiraceae bacterium C1.1]